MRIGTLRASSVISNHGTIRGGSFLSALKILGCFISTIIFSSAVPPVN